MMVWRPSTQRDWKNGESSGALLLIVRPRGNDGLFSIITNLLHLGMVIVGLDYGHAGQSTLQEITGGSPDAAATIAASDGSRRPTENELAGARYQGRRIAETAKKLHG
jgi:NAD(P)H dehydrogenase (quinone)